MSTRADAFAKMVEKELLACLDGTTRTQQDVIIEGAQQSVRELVKLFDQQETTKSVQLKIFAAMIAAVTQLRCSKTVLYGKAPGFFYEIERLTVA